MAYAPFATSRSVITAISCPTTSIPEEWEERGGTTIRTTFRQFTGGATEKRDLLVYSGHNSKLDPDRQRQCLFPETWREADLSVAFRLFA